MSPVTPVGEWLTEEDMRKLLCYRGEWLAELEPAAFSRKQPLPTTEPKKI